jgi:glycosyltransferase involved in cell wall biosynthesis
MSVYNGQAFLAEAVESVLDQTFRDFEFIVIDDGSADRTSEILSAYARREARLRVLHQQNKGRTESLNIGIGLAKGKYIARMDADDISLPDRFKAQVEFMEQHPKVGLLGGAVELINQNGIVIRTAWPPLEDAGIKSVLVQYNPMYHPAVMMRKQVALDAGGYRTAFSESEDYDLWLRMGERSQLANLEQVVLRYRVHPSQASIANMKHQVLCVLAARAAATVRREGGPDPLAGVTEITPEFVHALGITLADSHRALLGTYTYWIDLLGSTDPETTLRIIESFLQSPEAAALERSALAEIWLKAATIHYRQGRPGKAFSSVGRALLARPVVAGRPVKRALTRLAATFKG